jgi:hypothetical protein
MLVKDKQAPGDDPLEISPQCMLFSRINLLIFTLRGKKHGVIDELAFLTSDPQMRDKIQFSIVFYQMYDFRDDPSKKYVAFYPELFEYPHIA